MFRCHLATCQQLVRLWRRLPASARSWRRALWTRRDRRMVPAGAICFSGVDSELRGEGGGGKGGRERRTSCWAGPASGTCIAASVRALDGRKGFDFLLCIMRRTVDNVEPVKMSEACQSWCCALLLQLCISSTYYANAHAPFACSIFDTQSGPATAEAATSIILHHLVPQLLSRNRATHQISSTREAPRPSQHAALPVRSSYALSVHRSFASPLSIFDP